MLSTSDRSGSSSLIFAVLPPLFWAGNFLLARAFHADIPPFQMSFWRWVLAFLILLPFAMPALKTSGQQVGREWPWLAVLGVIGVTAFNCFIYQALHYTTVVNAALINSLMPVMTLFFAFLFLKARVSSRQLLGVAMAMIGAIIIISRGNILVLSALMPQYGDVLVFFGMSAWALYTVLIRWKPTKLQPTVFLLATIGFGIIGHLPAILWEIATVGTPTLAVDGALAIAYFAVFPSLLAYIFWNRAVKQLGPGRAAVFMYLMPIFAAALAIIFLKEDLHSYHLAGMAIIVTGLTISMRAPSKPPAVQEAVSARE